MKQSAVEWLYERLERMIPKTPLYNMDKEQYFKQAKEMEKQQIKDAWDASDTNMRNQFSSSSYKAITFNEWFKNK
jgi:tRNA U54 and U55 pseudouridine synthase Pus10